MASGSFALRRSGWGLSFCSERFFNDPFRTVASGVSQDSHRAGVSFLEEIAAVLIEASQGWGVAPLEQRTGTSSLP
jgi:hypothetical protein